jgi:hypothetical protein
LTVFRCAAYQYDVEPIAFLLVVGRLRRHLPF